MVWNGLIAAKKLGHLFHEVVAERIGRKAYYTNYASSIKDAKGIEFKMGRIPTISEVEQIYAAFSQAAGHTEWAPGVTRDGLRVLNFTDTPNKVIHEIVRGALASLPGIDGEFVRFGSVGDYIGNDWEESPNGEDYR